MTAALAHLAFLRGRQLSPDSPQSTLIRFLDTFTVAFVIAPWLLWLPRWLALPGTQNAKLAAIMAMLAGYSFLAVAVNRLSGLGAATLEGAWLVRANAGPVEIDRSTGMWRRHFAPWMLGWCMVYASERKLRSSVFLATLAGPLITGALGLLCADWFVITASRPGPGPVWPALLAAALLGNSAASLFPVSFRGFHTDGAVLRGLLRREERFQQRLAVDRALSSLRNGVRPRDWSEATARALTALGDESPEYFSGQYLAYLRALDLGDPCLAHHHIAEAVDRHGDAAGFPPLFSVEIAYFQARHRRRPDSARQWLAACNGGQGAPEVIVNRALAAVHLAEGNAAGARFCLNRIEALLPETDESGFAVLERDLALDLRSRLEDIAGQQSAPEAAESNSPANLVAPSV